MTSEATPRVRGFGPSRAEVLEQRIDDCFPRPGQLAPCQFESCPARSLSTISRSRRKFLNSTPCPQSRRVSSMPHGGKPDPRN